MILSLASCNEFSYYKRVQCVYDVVKMRIAICFCLLLSRASFSCWIIFSKNPSLSTHSPLLIWQILCNIKHTVFSLLMFSISWSRRFNKQHHPAFSKLKPLFTVDLDANKCLLKGLFHCVKSVQIQSFFWSVFSRIWTEYGEIMIHVVREGGAYYSTSPETYFPPYLRTLLSLMLF